jgi:hypothetical protein
MARCDHQLSSLVRVPASARTAHLYVIGMSGNVLATQAEHPYDIAAIVLGVFRRTWPECLREAPHFSNEEARLWCSRFAPLAVLPGQIREVFERTGYGCLAAEANVGVVHVCHAADRDVEGFAGKPVLYRWQLIEMPTAPLIRLEVAILDRPSNPYRFESFLNAGQEDQARVLAELAHQDRLYLAFYGDDLTHRFTHVVDHDEQQWQYLDELVAEAVAYWDRIPPEQRDLDRGKAEFLSRSDNLE